MKKKKSSENDQTTGHFQSFFLFSLSLLTLNLGGGGGGGGGRGEGGRTKKKAPSHLVIFRALSFKISPEQTVKLVK